MATDDPGQQAGQQQQSQGDGQSGQNGQNAGGQQQQPGQEPAWKTALGIPAHMLKDSAEDTLGEVFKGYKGFLEKQSAQGAVGKSPDDYKIEVGDKLKPYFSNGDDPAMKAFQAFAHENGMPVKLANKLVNDVFGKLAETGKLPPPFNPQAEMDGIAALLGKTGQGAREAADQALVEAEGWARNFGQQLKLDDGEQLELESLLLSRNGFGLVRKLQGAANGPDGMKLGGVPSGELSKDEVFAMFNDVRANPRHPKFEQAFLDRAEAQMERLRAKAKG